MHRSIEYKRARELFNYHKDGHLVWKKNEKIAGTKSTNNYMQVKIGDKIYYLHRVIYLWHKGYWPENSIDHIDRDPTNNRINNLREVTRSCNLRNTGNRKDNKSGVKGVYWNQKDKKWISRIEINNKTKYIGSFKELSEAALYRFAAEQCLGWNKCDSNSPAYQYIINNKFIKKGDYLA